MSSNRFVALAGRALLLGALTMGIAACDAMMSNERITANTAQVVGVPPTDLTISNRRTEGPADTYYIARTTSGAQYVCVISGGGVLATGAANPPSCDRML
jgi:hypothetical protein